MDITKLTEQLTAERAHLLDELNAIARVKPDTPGDWQAIPEDGSIDTREDVAEKFEELEERRATEHNLEISLREVEAALERIKTGTFGKCEVGGEPIEEERLKANPAARTCKVHINDLNGR